jgi:hypothetical protein
MPIAPNVFLVCEARAPWNSNIASAIGPQQVPPPFSPPQAEKTVEGFRVDAATSRLAQALQKIS